jgi:hypothetical protein
MLVACACLPFNSEHLLVWATPVTKGYVWIEYMCCRPIYYSVCLYVNKERSYAERYTSDWTPVGVKEQTQGICVSVFSSCFIVPVPTFECQYYIWTSKIREAMPKVKTHALFFMWIFDNKRLWFGSVAQKTVILDYREKRGLCVVVVPGIIEKQPKTSCVLVVLHVLEQCLCLCFWIILC